MMASRRLCTAVAKSFHFLPLTRLIRSACTAVGRRTNSAVALRTLNLDIYNFVTLPAGVTAAVIDQWAVRQQNHPNEYLIQF